MDKKIMKSNFLTSLAKNYKELWNEMDKVEKQKLKRSAYND